MDLFRTKSVDKIGADTEGDGEGSVGTLSKILSARHRRLQRATAGSAYSCA